VRAFGGLFARSSTTIAARPFRDVAGLFVRSNASPLTSIASC
jgi:hypothetical protein